MKQFSTILKFELLAFLKNKIFIGITLFLVIAVTLGMFLPMLIASLGEDETPPDELPVMLVHAEDQALSALALTYFTEAFTDYRVTSAEGSVSEMRDAVVRGDAACAFDLTSLTTFTYYVNNLSMYDMNTATATALLTEIYRINAMIMGGISPDEAGSIMSTVIESETVTLGKDQMENFVYTYVMIFALYMVILLYGQMVASNVASEKSSRAMELLITSTSPVSMMFGKVLAACIAGFSQLVLIFGSAILCYRLGGEAVENPILASIFDIPTDLFFYMLLYFVLGYLLFAFMFGAVGSTASKLEDINTSVTPISFLFVIGFLVVSFALSSGNVDSTVMRVCSFIPFTSPMAMFTRIAMSSVPVHEILLSVALLIGTTVFVGILSARIYRVGVLLYGKPPKLTTLIKTVLKKTN